MIANLIHAEVFDASKRKGGKKKLSSLLTILLILMMAAGCSASSAPVVIEGYETYVNEVAGYTVQYTPDWILIESDLTVEEVLELFEDYTGNSITEMLGEIELDLSSGRAEWFEYDDATGDLVTSAGINVTDSGGVKLNDLKSERNQADLQEVLVDAYSSILDNFQLVLNMHGKTLGKNYYVIFQYLAELTPGQSRVFIQAMTINGSDLYTISLSTTVKNLSTATYQLEQMLSTLQFK